MNESYARRGYAERDYAEPGYAEPGYAERGHAERGYAERDYARGGRKSPRTDSTRTGGVIVAALAILSSFLVLWGLYYATGTGERHKVALAAAGCEPNLLSVNVGCTTVQMLNSQYKGIVNPAILQLNADVADYTAAEGHNLAAAETALRAEVTTADGLAKSLAQVPFPPFAAHAGEVAIQAIQARVKLMTEQAQSSSLTQLRSFNGRVNASAAVILTDLTRLGKAVAHHPSVSQEP
jgi:hypothetical protein